MELGELHLAEHDISHGPALEAPFDDPAGAAQWP